MLQKKGQKYSVLIRILKRFSSQRGLNDVLVEFYVNVRQANGQNYMVSLLDNLRHGLNCFLKSPPHEKAYNISREKWTVQGQLSTPKPYCACRCDQGVQWWRQSDDMIVEYPWNVYNVKKYLTCYVIMTSSVNVKRSILTYLYIFPTNSCLFYMKPLVAIKTCLFEISGNCVNNYYFIFFVCFASEQDKVLNGPWVIKVLKIA